jgi:hypothetical protein
VIDELLDIEGVEVDPANTLEKNTPLHEAVQLAKDNEKLCLAVVTLLVEAGADPRYDFTYFPLYSFGNVF